MTQESKIVYDKKKELPWVELHADKSKPVLVRTSEQEIVSTGAEGVSRQVIERIGGEVARATTIVHYVPNKAFPRHVHSGGEEFVVLQGVWRDDYGAFPKYSYVRNYIGSSHEPSMGPEGCAIMVKLRQMSTKVEEPLHTSWNADPKVPEGWEEAGPNRKVKHIYKSELETVSFEQWAPGFSGVVDVPQHGKEIFVIDGSFTTQYGEHDERSWLRVASGEQAPTVSAVGPEGCFVYVKEGHLASDEVSVDMALKPKDWK